MCAARELQVYLTSPKTSVQSRKMEPISAFCPTEIKGTNLPLCKIADTSL